MKIIHFHPNARMAEKFVMPLIKAERGLGYQTLLITSSNQSKQDATVVPYDLSGRNLIKLPFALASVIYYLLRFRPNIIFSHNSKSSLLPLIGAWLAGVPVRIYFNHGVPYIGHRGVLRYMLYTLELCNIALASHVLTVSTDMCEILQNIKPMPRPKLINHGSACGIDLDEFSSDVLNKSNWRKSHGIMDKDFVVAYIGRPEKRKGFDVVLRLWLNHFHEKHFKLVLCGPDSNDLLKHLKFKPHNVISLGFVTSIPEVLSNSDLLILPSLHEGLSYACLEAQAAGIPVLANEIPGIRSIIENGVSGFLVPNNDILKYAAIIRILDKDRARTKAIQLAAKKNVRKFSRKFFISSYITFLNELPSKKVELKSTNLPWN